MSKFIYPEEKILQIIPNIQVAVDGELSWQERLDPFITIEEKFVEDSVASFEIIKESDLVEDARRLIVWRAWAKAIPALDLVATPNGFAVVSNQTLAPASQARVDAAKRNAIRYADEAAVTLIMSLMRVEDWRKSNQAKRFLSLFPDLRNFSFFIPEADLGVVNFVVRNHGNINVAETIVAVNVISSGAMNRLREMALELAIGAGEDISPEDIRILEAVRKAVALQISDPVDQISYVRQCDLIRKLLDSAVRSEISECWKNSILYLAFKKKPFKNEKNSGGFFF